MAKSTQQLKTMMKHYSSQGVNKVGAAKSSGAASRTAHTAIKHVKATPPNLAKKGKGGRKMKAGKY